MWFSRRYIDQVNNLLKRDKLLVIVGLAFPLLFGGFLLLPTGVHRNLMYLFLAPMIMLLFRDREDLISAIKMDRIFWGIFFSFLVYMTASVVWSETAENGRYFEKGKLLFLISIPLLASLHVVRKIPVLALLSIISYIAVAALTAIYLLIASDFYRDGHLIRLQGLGRASNPVGAGLLYTLAFLATMSLGLKTRKYFLGKLAVLLILGLVVFFANSRGAILALSISSLIFGLIEYRKLLSKERVVIFSALFVVLGWGIFCFFDDANFFQRADTGRIQIWEQALGKIGEAAVFGHGLASKFIFTFTTVGITVPSHVGHAHSLYLSTALQGGFVGLSLFFMLFYLSILRSYKLYRLKNIAWPFLFILCGGIIGFFDFGGYIINLSVEWLVFWWPSVMSSALLSIQPLKRD